MSTYACTLDTRRRDKIHTLVPRHCKGLTSLGMAHTICIMEGALIDRGVHVISPSAIAAGIASWTLVAFVGCSISLLSIACMLNKLSFSDDASSTTRSKE